MVWKRKTRKRWTNKETGSKIEIRKQPPRDGLPYWIALTQNGKVTQAHDAFDTFEEARKNAINYMEVNQNA